MNEFVFRVTKAAVCAAASYVAGKFFESVAKNHTKLRK